MLGAGGVGIAIALGLQKLGVSELVVSDLDRPLAENLVTQCQKKSKSARIAGADLVAEMESADGLINATPVGMFQYSGIPFPEQGMGAQRWAFDAVYTSVDTLFLQQRKGAGMEILSGFRLFLYQGLNAFTHFTRR